MTLTQEFDFLFQWHLTERCNLKCRHCYQSGTGRGELTLAEIAEVTDEIAEMLTDWENVYGVAFSPSFNITGGEPFLRADFFAILAEMTGRGFPLFILSNGTLIDGAAAERLARLGVKGVQVSIEGPEEVHEGIRGRGSFAASLAGVRNLRGAGLPVTLNVTLSRLNAGHMPAIVELASSLGVQRLGFSRMVPSGQGAAIIGQMLDTAEVGELYERLFARAVPGLEIVTGDPVAAQLNAAPGSPIPAPDIPCGGCAAGVSGLTILADGTVVPCRRLEIPIGNVRTDSLREIWADSEVLAGLRDKGRYRGTCGSCDRWADCRGCRAIAYAYSRSQGKDDFLAGDPQCFIRGK